MALLLTAVAVVALILSIRRPRSGDGGEVAPGSDGDIDREELESAEREVRDLDAFRRPEDGFQGDDWGPGAPRR